MAVHICIDCAALPEAEQPKRPRKIDKRSKDRKPLCRTHYLEKRSAVKQGRRDAYVERVYRMPRNVYHRLLAYQGGRCYICRVATGASKALAIDHDHRLARQHDHPVNEGCLRCDRGALCSRCNELIGFLGPEALLRAVNYLRDPPLQRMLREAIEE